MLQARAPFGPLLLALTLVAAACSSGTPAGTTPASAPAASSVAASPSSGGTSAEPSAAAGAWDDILAAAKGKTVNWYMWGGDETINKLVTGYLNDEAQKLRRHDQSGPRR